MSNIEIWPGDFVCNGFTFERSTEQPTSNQVSALVTREGSAGLTVICENLRRGNCAKDATYPIRCVLASNADGTNARRR
jgi:hypothetical protein